MTKNILLLFSVISKALIILYIISSACKYSLYLVAFPMRNIKAFYSYHNYKECNIHILIMPLTRISKHRINFPNRWNEADAQSSFWNGCYHNFHFLQRSFFFVTHTRTNWTLVFCPEDKRRQSQSEDGRGVQGVIRLVTAAAAAAVSDSTRLRGVRLLLASLVCCSMGCAGGAGVHRSWGVGEHHASSEGRGRRSRREHRGVERLWIEGYSRDGWCHRLVWDGYLRFGLLHLCW